MNPDYQQYLADNRRTWFHLCRILQESEEIIRKARNEPKRVDDSIYVSPEDLMALRSALRAQASKIDDLLIDRTRWDEAREAKHQKDIA